MKAKFKSVKITPNYPCKLSGFAHRDNPTSIIKHDLYATLCMMENVVILSIETLFITQNFKEALERNLQENYNISCELIISATHTHYAPAIENYFWFEGTKKYTSELLDVLSSRIAKLYDEKYQDYEVSFGKVISKQGRNRISENKVSTSEISLLVFKNKFEKNALVIVDNHPTIQGVINEVSGDFFSIIRQEMIKESYSTVLFFCGFSGNISTRFVRRFEDYDENLNDIGMKLFEEIKSIDLSAIMSSNIQLHINSCDAIFKNKDVEKTNKRLEKAMADLKDTTDNMQKYALLQKIEGLKIFLSSLDFEFEKTVPVVELYIGNVRLVFLSGEPFVEMKNDVSESIYIGYSNGYIGYIYDSSALDSYESTTSLLTVENFEMIKEKINDKKDILQ